MHVLLVTPWFPSAAHSGSGIFNLRDAALLAKQHSVRVIHLIRPDWADLLEAQGESMETVVEGLPVLRVRFSAGDPRTYLGARRAILAELPSADLLHTMALPALLPLAFGRVALPWVHTEHWSGLSAGAVGGAALTGRLLKALLRAPDRVVAVSRSLADSIAACTRFPPVVIGNAVPLPPEAQISAPFEQGQRLRIVSVGGVSANKGPVLAVETVARLADLGVVADLRWLGSGPQLEEAESRAAELGVSSQVSFLGQLSTQAVQKELLGAHLFMLPTAGETFGIAIAEALGCGLPVVTSGTGGHVDLLSGFEASRVVARNAETLASAVLELIREDSGEQRAVTSERARQGFSDVVRAEAYRRVYSEAHTHASRRQ